VAWSHSFSDNAVYRALLEIGQSGRHYNCCYAVYKTGECAIHLRDEMAALPGVTTLVRQAVLQQRFAESKERDYVFREHVTINKLRKACTWAPKCPGHPTPSHPVGVSYEVLQYTGLEFEIFWLDGMRVARVMPTCQRCLRAKDNGLTQIIPMSDSEIAAENQRLDSEIAAARVLRKRGKDANSPNAPPQILLSRMLELCSFLKSASSGPRSAKYFS
jgi:hypothetical protein